MLNLVIYLVPSFIIIFVCIMYFHYGIKNLTDFLLEFKIIKATLRFIWSAFRIESKKINYVKMWNESVRKFGSRTFIKEAVSSRSCTFGEVDRLSDSVAKYLYEKGVDETKTVAIMMENGIEFVVSWLAVIKLGARPALINTNLRGASLSHCVLVLDDCKLLLVNNAIQQRLAMDPKLLVLLKVAVIDLWNKEQRPGVIGDYLIKLMEMISNSENPDKWAGLKKGPGALVGFIYTSGTTGYPKAVPISFSKIWSVVKVFFIDRYSITEEDKIYSVLPLYHSTALCIGLHIAMLSGGEFITRDKLSVQQFWEDMHKNNATIFLYVGEMCRFLLNRKNLYVPKLSFKTRLCIGNGLDKKIYNDFKDAFQIPQIGEFYSQTEGFAFLGSVLQLPGSLGYIPKLKITKYPYRVIRCNVETLEPVREYNSKMCYLCKMNEPGLLVVNESNLGKRAIYHKSTHDLTYIGGVERPGDRFVSTGDLVTIGTDRSYYFVDRLGDTFRWKGENVSTQEVSGIIARVKGVEQVCVYGVNVPGCNGRAGMAALVINPDKFTFSEMYKVCTINLPKYAIPLFIRTVNSLETTATFKYKTSQLKEERYDTVHSTNMYMADHGQRTYSQITEKILHDIKNCRLKY